MSSSTDGETATPPVAKARSAMRTIGEASTELGVKPHILRYWETQFDMLEPLKRAGGRRYYRPEDMELLRTIDQLLNQQGYTIRGAGQYLRKRKASAAPTSAPASTPAASGDTALPADTVAELRAIRAMLKDALAAAE